jgi:hypothetical protein
MPDYCKHRGRYNLVKTEIANGSIQVRKLCHECWQVFDSAVSKKGLDLDALELYETGYFNPPCARCGNPHTEFHHYMPRSLARKAKVNPEEWGGVYLCDDCHNTWHRIVTPGLVPDAERVWEEPKP